MKLIFFVFFISGIESGNFECYEAVKGSRRYQPIKSPEVLVDGIVADYDKCLYLIDDKDDRAEWLDAQE